MQGLSRQAGSILDVILSTTAFSAFSAYNASFINPIYFDLTFLVTF
ncbi:MAG TPA: hypothetical protein VJ583_08000 [Nitrososphaeraceae archaeon]|nr:hypothetical protein [Nitrososphaeraceae archaeon]